MATMPKNVKFDTAAVSKRILAARLDRDMSYADLERITGMPRSTFMRLEKSLSEGVSYITLLSVAKALRVDLNWLCGYEQE